MSSTNSADIDPALVPVSHAATVMLVDDRPDLHVLMLRRTKKVVFASAMWVFPGGRVDPDDHHDDFNHVCDGLSDAEASTILDVPSGGLAWWIAACRETLEEAGLLLAAGAVDPALLVELTDAVRQDENRFVELLVDEGLRLDTSLVEEVARFITPVGPPRRFDARFFVAKAPDGQEPIHDNSEIVAWEWVRPSEALERWTAGEFDMMSPTVRMVACLARYETATDVMAAAKQRLPYRRVRVNDPYGAYQVLLPGEPGYETAELEIESGWVRLWEADHL